MEQVQIMNKSTFLMSRRQSIRQAALQLSAALEQDDKEAFMNTLMEVVRANGFTETAREAGLSRTSLYKTVSPARDPRFDTMIALLSALGLRLCVAVDRRKPGDEGEKRRA